MSGDDASWLIILLLSVITLLCAVFGLVKVNKLQRRVINNHSRMLALVDFSDNHPLSKTDLESEPAMLEKTVHHSAVAVENLHLTLSETAFGVINTIAPNVKTKVQAQRLKERHNQAATGIYRSVKKANKKIGSLTNTRILSKKIPTPFKKKH